MSQSHPGSFAKKAQKKAEMANARENKVAQLAMGLTKDMKQAIKGDSLLCTDCGATQLGPKTCTCKGGKSKPAGGYDATKELMAAAKARHAIKMDGLKKANAAEQAGVAKGRGKKKAADKLDPYSDPNAVFAPLPGTVASGDYATHEKTEMFTFKAGPLGLSIENNVINKLGKKGSQAYKLKIQPGWVMAAVAGQVLPLDKPGIMAVVKKANEEAKAVPDDAGTIEIVFRIASQANYTYCGTCNHFKMLTDFEAGQLAEGGPGPGLQKCKPCNGVLDDEDY